MTEGRGDDRLTVAARRVYTADDAQRERVAEQIRVELAGEAAVVFAYLYGSFVESPSYRDVDVGVYVEAAAPDQASAKALDLSGRLSDRVGLPVDVRALNGAPVSFLFHVFRGRLLLSRDDARLEDLIERTAHRYLDIAPVLRRSTKDAFAA
jgi:predicted nucleotidyltransferase